MKESEISLGDIYKFTSKYDKTYWYIAQCIDISERLIWNDILTSDGELDTNFLLSLDKDHHINDEPQFIVNYSLPITYLHLNYPELFI